MAAKNVNRRRFLTDMAKTACGVSLFGLGLGLYSRQGQSLPAEYIRPPGALDEEKFLSACVRCGACVEDCPYHILKLAELGKDNAATGTPYFKARAGACEMCEDIPCIPNCPTGALDHSLKDINKARMGLAVLIDQETCIAFQGLRCEVCYNICPLKGKALTLEYQPNKRTFMHAMFIPTVHSRYCTGCGLCERACILEREAIKVLPIRLAKGELGHHYRFGWKEKEKAGHALVTPDPKHHFRLPKGETYDYEGAGRIHKVNPGGSSGKASGSSGSSGGAAAVLNGGIKEAK